jgi:hypothetical protein
MAWIFEGARVRKVSTAIVAAATTIRDDAATPAEGETAEAFAARSRRTYTFTRGRNDAGTAFTQSPEEFRAMVRQETAAHIVHRNALAAIDPATWEDAPTFAP